MTDYAPPRDNPYADSPDEQLYRCPNCHDRAYILRTDDDGICWSRLCSCDAAQEIKHAGQHKAAGDKSKEAIRQRIKARAERRTEPAGKPVHDEGEPRRTPLGERPDWWG
jgi:hypothetical protein